MHVAIVGAGALGRVFGVKLAVAGTAVTFVVRGPRLREAGPFRIERIDGDGRVDELLEPVRASTVPKDAGCVVVCVRAPDMTPSLQAALCAGRAPVLVMTPLMPRAWALLSERLGPRLLAAMPGVVAHEGEGGAVRYWLPRFVRTLVERPRAADTPAVASFVDALLRAGVPAKAARRVRQNALATTLVLAPLGMGVDVAGGSTARLASDDATLATAVRAGREALALSRGLGRAAPWSTLLVRAGSPGVLRRGLALARRRSPEAVRFVEEHYGDKLHLQNVAMAEEMVQLAREQGVPHDGMTSLLERLSRGGASARTAPGGLELG